MDIYDPSTQKKEPVNMWVKVGQKVRFDPFATILGYGVDEMRKEVVGIVVDIYHDHKWFSVQHGKLRTSFKFCDIGDRVHICK